MVWGNIRFLVTIAWAAALFCGSGHVRPETVFFDGFAVSGERLDLATWTTEFGKPSFLGRTQLRDWVTPDGVGRFVVADGFARLSLNTHNPTGTSLYGTHAKTLQSFQPTASTGYELAVRMRLASLQPGLVFGVYFFGCNAGPCNTHHDELDIELVTNFLQPGGSPLRIQLNRYAAEPLGAGHGPIVNLPSGFDPLAFHEWKIRWHRNRVSYFVDGVELFSATTFIPQGRMQATIIVWGPTFDMWPDAFHGSLQDVTDAAKDQRFDAFIDYVSVATVPIQLSPAIPLLLDE